MLATRRNNMRNEECLKRDSLETGLTGENFG